MKMRWQLRDRFDRQCLPIANRHYNRQNHDSPQFAPPGRCVVLYAETETGCALWISSFQQYVLHAWPGAWNCSCFRNEGAGLSSELIVEAVAATLFMWGEPSEVGFITFVDRSKTRPKKTPGYCYRVVGWEDVGRTKVNGLVVLQLTPDKMPEPCAPIGAQLEMLRGAK